MKTKALKNKNWRDFEKRILAGEFKDHYLVYNRKSTDEPENQKNSLEFQKSENLRFASRENFKIAKITIPGFCTDGIIAEKHSGFKEDIDFTMGQNGMVQLRVDRPKFYKLIGYLSQGLFKGVVCLCWDRISRNKADEVLVNKLMKQGIDVRFTLATYDKTSAGNLHMDIDGMFSVHHSRVTSEKVRIAIKNSRSQGKVTNRAPIGYLNEGNMDWKPLDPVRAPIIKQMYEMYATGDWSLSDLARWANQNGLTTVPMRRKRTVEEILSDEGDEKIDIPQLSRPLTLGMVHKILTNPFYKGLTMGAEGHLVVSTSHEPLVTDELFDTVQRALEKKNVSAHYAEVIALPYRKLVRCTCGRVYTPYTKKGIRYLYSRCGPECENTEKNVSAADLEEAVGKALHKLAFTQSELEEIDARTRTDIALFENKRHKELEQMERRKKKIREDLTYLRTNKIPLLSSGVYTPVDYLAEESKLNSELTALQNEEQASDVSMAATIKEVVKLSELVKDLGFYYDLANAEEKDLIMRRIFSELTLRQNVLEFQCKTAFKSLESRFVPDCDPTGNRTRINGLKSRRPNR